MFGLELLGGALLAWVVRKGRRLGGQLDTQVDQALDEGLDRMFTIIKGKLGDDPALARLEDEAARGISEDRTLTRVRLAVEDAAADNEQFRGQLVPILEDIQRHSAGLTIYQQTNTADGNAVINAVQHGNQYNFPAERPMDGSPS